MCYTMAIIKHAQDSIGMAPPQDWRNRPGQPRALDPDNTNQGTLRSSDTCLTHAPMATSLSFWRATILGELPLGAQICSTVTRLRRSS